MVLEMRESVMDTYVRRATADMYRNSRKYIRCPCRTCKLQCMFEPSSGELKSHLLRRGFMEGHTEWMSDEEVSEEEWQQDNNGDEEDPAHDDGDQRHDDGDQHVEDADMNTRPPLNSVVHDPHVQELLLNQTRTDSRGADRRKSKLKQLEVDSNTPLYDTSRGPEESRLRVAFDILQMKAQNGWSDKSTDDLLQYMKKRLPKDNTCPGSLDEVKKIVCPFDLPHMKYHACINDCIIYRKEHADKTKCPVCDEDRYKVGKKAP